MASISLSHNEVVILWVLVHWLTQQFEEFYSYKQVQYWQIGAQHS